MQVGRECEASNIRPAALPVVMLLALTGCLKLDDIKEFSGLSYPDYRAAIGGAWFDPVGAADISHRSSSTRDGYDAWWRFTIAPAEFETLVASVAATESGPEKVEWTTESQPPAHWRADAELPPWWNAAASSAAQSLHWCFAAGDAERHHGWFFRYDASTRQALVWHWNHQWSSGQCR